MAFEDPPETRTVHICRLPGTNRDGDVLPDVWVDLERVGVQKAASQRDGHWQGRQHKYRWLDDPTADDYNPDGNPARTYDRIKVCSPDEVDVNDPDEWVEVPVVRRMKPSGGDGTTGQQGYQHQFQVDPSGDGTTSRSFETRKISHYDTNIDDAAQAAFEAGQKSYVVQYSEYARDESTKDDQNYVHTDIVRWYKSSGNSDGVTGQGRQDKLQNQYLIDNSDDPGSDVVVVGTNGFNPPYRLDPQQTIVNVNFGNLAVEFDYDGPSNLQLDGEPSQLKFFVSVWFRVPQAAIDEARTQFAPYKATGGSSPPAAPPLKGVVPIMIAGPRDLPIWNQDAGDPIVIGTYESTLLEWAGHPTCGWVLPIEPPGVENPSTINITGSTIGAWHKTGQNIEPSYIGVNCRSDRNILDFNFLLPGASPTLVGFQLEAVSGSSSATTAYLGHAQGTGDNACDGYPSQLDPTTGATIAPFYSATQTTSFNDISSTLLPHSTEAIRAMPSYDDEFGNGDFTPDASVGTDITADHWHHLILSVISKPVISQGGLNDDSDRRVTSAFDVHVSLDDANVTGSRISYFMAPGSVNEVMTPHAFAAYGSQTVNSGFIPLTAGGFSLTIVDEGKNRQSYRLETPPVVPMSDIAIPGDLTTVHRCEMGEFQLFGGQSLDTSSVANRRLFVDDSGKPVPPVTAKRALGDPDILLHGSSKWKKGVNDGSLGIDFTPSGKIRSWRPNPSLHGKQSP